jgi:hypothetical protein
MLGLLARNIELMCMDGPYNALSGSYWDAMPRCKGEVSNARGQLCTNGQVCTKQLNSSAHESDGSRGLQAPHCLKTAEGQRSHHRRPAAAVAAAPRWGTGSVRRRPAAATPKPVRCNEGRMGLQHAGQHR